MRSTFFFPTRIGFGPGALASLPEELERLGVKRPLLVTGAGPAHEALAGRAKELLARAGLAARAFAGVSDRPDDGQVEAALAELQAHQADGLVALGDGGPIDVAKAVRLLAHHARPLESFEAPGGLGPHLDQPLPPLVAVPTAGGAGSEVSSTAVLAVRALGREVYLDHPRLMPEAVVCDPELTLELGPRPTAEAGMHALSHGIEAYLASSYHPLADALALAGVGLLTRALPRAVADGRDLAARTDCLAAALMTATAFQKGLGVVHSLAYPLSWVVGVHHGLAAAVLLPHALRFDAETVPARVLEVARALGAEEASLENAGEEAALALIHLLEQLGLPQRLGQVGVEESHLAALVEKARQDPCHKTNPRPCSPADLETLYRAAL
jgi:alcohol dehydrogenase class IV